MYLQQKYVITIREALLKFVFLGNISRVSACPTRTKPGSETPTSPATFNSYPAGTTCPSSFPSSDRGANLKGFCFRLIFSPLGKSSCPQKYTCAEERKNATNQHYSTGLDSVGHFEFIKIEHPSNYNAFLNISALVHERRR